MCVCHNVACVCHNVACVCHMLRVCCVACVLCCVCVCAFSVPSVIIPKIGNVACVVCPSNALRSVL